ncbi:S41 family peptidase [Microbulbifer sp. OS29]|uniref:S41 family peptidase n=1 Tax=Microbulbifer okhotskensis TaxID=2926617 RepID=A0A9X2J870_9GAMM|nr:S41 family peptidase [Microbulbifer okhotskensis]MCO1335236.1 S41 family peptidase [Microbulbifer okhotskensis]
MSDFCNDYQAFADKLIEKIHAQSEDKHFYVAHTNSQEANRNWIEQWRAEAPNNNYGVKEIKLLLGNIAYFSLSSFHSFQHAKETLTAAFTLIQYSNGLILDLLGNGGDNEQTANAILESFIDAETPLPFVIESRQEKVIPPVPSLFPGQSMVTSGHR